MIFSEDSRVKIPCILHLARLGEVSNTNAGATNVHAHNGHGCVSLP